MKNLSIFDVVENVMPTHRGVFTAPAMSSEPFPNSPYPEEGAVTDENPLDYDLQVPIGTARLVEKEQTNEDKIYILSYLGAYGQYEHNSYVSYDSSNVHTIYTDKTGLNWECSFSLQRVGDNEYDVTLTKKLNRVVSNEFTPIASDEETVVIRVLVEERSDNLNEVFGQTGINSKSGAGEIVQQFRPDNVSAIMNASDTGRVVVVSDGNFFETAYLLIDYADMQCGIVEKPIVFSCNESQPEETSVQVWAVGTTSINYRDYDLNNGSSYPATVKTFDFDLETREPEENNKTTSVTVSASIGAGIREELVDSMVLSDGKYTSHPLDFLEWSLESTGSCTGSQNVEIEGRLSRTTVDFNAPGTISPSEYDTPTPESAVVTAELQESSSVTTTTKITANETVIFEDSAQATTEATFERIYQVSLSTEVGWLGSDGPENREAAIVELFDEGFDGDENNITGSATAEFDGVSTSDSAEETFFLAPPANGPDIVLDKLMYTDESEDIEYRGGLQSFPAESNIFSFSSTGAADSNIDMSVENVRIEAEVNSGTGTRRRYASIVEVNSSNITDYYTKLFRIRRIQTVVAGDAGSSTPLQPVRICPVTGEVNTEVGQEDQNGYTQQYAMLTVKKPTSLWSGSALPAKLQSNSLVTFYIGYIYESELPS